MSNGRTMGLPEISDSLREIKAMTEKQNVILTRIDTRVAVHGEKIIEHAKLIAKNTESIESGNREQRNTYLAVILLFVGGLVNFFFRGHS